MDNLIYDLSLPVDPRIAVWPGDRAFSYLQSCRIEDGDSVNLGSIEMSLHTGTHMDAFFHYMPQGASIDQLPLDACIGKARLLSRIGTAPIEPSELEAVLEESPERLLIRTLEARDPHRFPEEYGYLSVAAARAVAEAGVKLIGLDSPSVDHLQSRDIPVHKTLGEAGIVILENLLLEGVPEGDYELIALPLKITGADGSPVRAILRTLA